MPTRIFCELCGAHVPDRGFVQHCAGRRHLSLLYHGDERLAARRIHPPNSPTSLHARDVPAAVVYAARRSRELVLRTLVEHTGVDMFQQACERFETEALCSALFYLYTLLPAIGAWPPGAIATGSHVASGKGWSKTPTQFPPVGSIDAGQDGGAATSRLRRCALYLACVADWIASGRAPPCHDVRLVVAGGDSDPGEGPALEDVAISGALHAFASALGNCDRGLGISLYINGCMRQRRLAATFTRAMCASLRRARWLRRLKIQVWATDLRIDDFAAMKTAAVEAWEARAVAFLLGSHPRVGAASPVRALPSALLLAILDAALKAGARTVVSVLPTNASYDVPIHGDHDIGDGDGDYGDDGEGGEGAAGAASAAPAAPTSVGGLDLEFAATFV